MQDETTFFQGQTVLVTGVAGFIGSHVTQRLLTLPQPPRQLIGLDSLNDYYSPTLKRARLQLLEHLAQTSSAHWHFLQADIAAPEVLLSTLQRWQPTLIVHLAAQAGVRYSLEHPQAYIDSNITGFFNLLEACRQIPPQHLVYASSSSVYGANTKFPYAESDLTDTPVSLYAATKKCDELLASSYASLYQLPATALRLFTVYGPWGRPDMACLRFAEAMTRGTPLPLYDSGRGQRDFTYIADTANGILKVLRCPPKGDIPHRVLNLGHGHPVTVRDFVSLLHQALVQTDVLPPHYDLEQHIRLLPPQPGDVTKTFADTRALEKLCGHRAQTTLAEGLRHFANWYADWWLPHHQA